MLSIHFTGADLARTHIAHCPDPFWETVLSLRKLQNGGTARLVFDPWRQQARRVMRGGSWRLLTELIPPRGNFPDLLTPTEGAVGLDEGLEAILSTPRRQLRAIPADAATRDLRDGDVDALMELTGAIREYHRVALRPHWQAMDRAVRVEQVTRTRALREGGVEAMLASLPWPLRWDSPVLSSAYAGTKTLHLEGRGITLIPSYFNWGEPVTLIDNDLPPVLVYSIERRPQAQTGATGTDHLAALLGATRAAVLSCCLDGHSTTELARLLALPTSSISDHTKVLRNAGLITSTRRANCVIHLATPLGRALLRQGAEDQSHLLTRPPGG